MFKKVIIDPDSNASLFTLRDTIFNEIKPILKQGRTIIVLCIGTDRSTGDSLGPLVGDKLKFLRRDGLTIYGNLEYPAHAKNILSVLDNINKSYSNPFIIAIDACLGSIQNVGKVILDCCPLYPGSAMDKGLPGVGDISISGVVNISGNMDFMVLQNTRLFTVVHLSEFISNGIYHLTLKALGGKSSSIKHSKPTIENVTSAVY